MIRTRIPLVFPALAPALALSLGACGAEEPTEADDPVTAADYIEEPTTTLSPLTSDQQLNRDRFDANEFQREYAAYREALATDSETDIPQRDEMDFAFLDRDANGVLSAPEYALWAVPGGMDAMASADGNYLSGDQAEGVTETYFYFDQDADGRLSESEFGAAQASNLVG